MRKISFLLSFLLLLPISANCASSTGKNDITIEAPQSAVAGEKITLTAYTSEPLPSSSFYRVDIECPRRPVGGEVTVVAGYPLIELAFGRAGAYTCSLTLGILTKSSCAGVQYKPLGECEFSIEVLPVNN